VLSLPEVPALDRDWQISRRFLGGNRACMRGFSGEFVEGKELLVLDRASMRGFGTVPQSPAPPGFIIQKLFYIHDGTG